MGQNPTLRLSQEPVYPRFSGSYEKGHWIPLLVPFHRAPPSATPSFGGSPIQSEARDVEEVEVPREGVAILLGPDPGEPSGGRKKTRTRAARA